VTEGVEMFNQDMKFDRMYREESGGDGDAGGTPDAAEKTIDPGIAALQEQFNASQAENARLLAKITEANKHTREAERQATEAARKKAEADGNYEQLFKSSETERQTLAEQLEKMGTATRKEKELSEAMKLAISLNPVSEFAAQDLAEKLAKRLKSTDEGIRITDNNGDLTVSKLEDLRKEFAGSASIAHLIKGNQSSGGGAAGGSNGGGAAKEITRAQFDALDPLAQAKFMSGGGKLTR
jgi:alanyl-tRNA synthetase